MTPSLRAIQSVCVYCGHQSGDQTYQNAAKELGRALADANFNLVYGGGKLGLMGIVADNVLANGGHVIGFIPHHLEEFEGAHPHIQELYRVDSMHTRKLEMSKRADAFLILPGGFGTLDELFEIITWKQLGLHTKPIIILNIAGYWDKLVALIHHLLDRGYVPEKDRDAVHVVERIADVIPYLESVQPRACTFTPALENLV